MQCLNTNKQVHELSGCGPEPVINYLKALGILRLVGRQADRDARGWWQGNRYFLSTGLEREELVTFFLEKYRPSPLVAPWNGGSGFYGKTAQVHLESIENSSAPRLEIYRNVIAGCRAILRKQGITAKKDIEKQKELFISQCRNLLPDDAVGMLDTMVAITSKKSYYAPLLGTGGNDGNLEFTNTFMKYLLLIMPSGANNQTKKVEKALLLTGARLESALFNTGEAPVERGAVGQFFPGGIGGVNGVAGFERESVVNPWDYVLAVEGTLMFSGAVARRHSSQAGSVAVFPFVVDLAPAGWEAVSYNDADFTCREIWFPLWDRPANLREMEYLFTEGRAQVGRRWALSGTDFARAAASLGVDRGIKRFQRVGFLTGERQGKMRLASPLGTFSVSNRSRVNLLQEVDTWHNTLRKLCHKKGAPASFRQNLYRVEESIFLYCRHGGARRMQEVLAALGDSSRAMARNFATLKEIRPLQLSPRWVKALDDGTPEYRLASAVASIQGNGETGPLRENLEPVRFISGRYCWVEKGCNVDVTDLRRTLCAILEKRCLAAAQAGASSNPLKGKVVASNDDINRLLAGKLDENYLLRLLTGMIFIDWHRLDQDNTGYGLPRSRERVNPAYALLKLIYWPNPLNWPPGSGPVYVRPEAAILKRLRGGDMPGAAAIALRRLKTSGLVPAISIQETRNFVISPSVSERLGAALLVPVKDLHSLAKEVLVISNNKEG